ncbi:MAG: S24 family peptidase [Deltaproteobacteria bacterium]
MDHNNEIGKRIKLVREALDLTQEEFGKGIGKSLNTILSWEAGRTRPPDHFMKVIEKIYNISPRWLRRGQGDMFMPDISSIMGGGGDLVEINIWELAGAGNPLVSPEAEPIEKVALPSKLVRNYTNGFRVEGDSMYPTIVNGAYVGFDPNDKKVVSNGIYCLNLPYEGYVVKRLEIKPNEIIVKSDNQMVEDYSVPINDMDRNLIVGRVRWIFQNV